MFGPCSAGLIKLKFISPIGLFLPIGLHLFVKQIGAEDKVIHLCSHKATVCIFWCADNRFTVNVKRGVDNNTVAGPVIKGANEVIVTWIILAINGLNPCRIIDVGYGRHIGSLLVYVCIDIISLRFICDCILEERESPIIERPPSARGPNSMRP